MSEFFNYDRSIYDKNVYFKQELKDYGDKPFVINIEKATKANDNFRLALWTGDYLQITLMSLKTGESIGLECHDNLDQFIRIEKGKGLVQMGENKEELTFTRKVEDDDAFVIPKSTWHNLTNTGTEELKLYSIYSTPNHNKGTIEKTKPVET